MAAVYGSVAVDQCDAAIAFTPFGVNGEGGTVNGQVLSFGSGGEVFELDAFVNVGGLDLNGGASGTSAQLSVNPLPSGFDYAFATELSSDEHDLSLRYQFTNSTGVTMSDVWFFSFVDAEIDVAVNDYFNEAGFQLGTVGAGPQDIDADSWEIDEPGYVFGDIFDNLLTGVLDNTNSVPLATPDDVSLALGFSLGDLTPTSVTTVEVHLTDDGTMTGSLALQSFDTDPSSFDTLTVSGNVITVPEPIGWSLLAIGAICYVVSRLSVQIWHRDALAQEG